MIACVTLVSSCWQPITEWFKLFIEHSSLCFSLSLTIIKWTIWDGKRWKFLITNRGFSYDVISHKFCKSSYSWLPCWFPLSTGQYGKHNKLFCYLFSSYHNTKLQLSDKNISVHTFPHTLVKFQYLPMK